MEQLPVVCPFCGDGGFDLIGLKHHFFAYCEEFDKVESITEERARLREERLDMRS